MMPYSPLPRQYPPRNEFIPHEHTTVRGIFVCTMRHEINDGRNRREKK